MYKRIIKYTAFTAIISSAAASAYAVAPGLYLGLMLGPATNSASTAQAQVEGDPSERVPANPRSSQFATRIFMGYKANQYAGVEGGISYFTGIKYDTKNVNTCSSTQSRVRDFDVVGKGEFPFYSFSIYGKAGAALVYQTTSGDLNNSYMGGCGRSTYTTKVRPTFSIGASYDLSQNVVTDLSYNKILVGSPINSVSFIGLGISYHFVDQYCGQFLC